MILLYLNQQCCCDGEDEGAVFASLLPLVRPKHREIEPPRNACKRMEDSARLTQILPDRKITRKRQERDFHDREQTLHGKMVPPQSLG
jgi:hypothetical protein